MLRKMKVALKYLIWLAVLLLVIVQVIAWIAAGRLLHPDRRPLQEYQRDWLKRPAAHGLRVHAGQCVQGRVPCLFVAPDAQAGSRERGLALRKQLEKGRASLMTYGKTQGILVLLHGRGGRKEDLLPVAERFAAAGFKCVIPDLPSHGDSPLNTARFAASEFERDIAGSVLTDARAYFHERSSPAGLWGLSMGGAFAVRALALDPSKWQAAVIVSSFDSLQGVVADKLDFLPVPLSSLLQRSLEMMMRLRGGPGLQDVQPDAWASSVTVPVMVAHGDRDQVVVQRRGRRLYNALHSRSKAWVNVPGADHRNVLVSSAALYARMSEWFIAHVR